MYFCMFCALSSKSSLVASRLSSSMYLSSSNGIWFLYLALVREPTSVHPLPQLLDVLAHQPISALFSLSLSLAFVLIPASTSFFVLSSLAPVLPSVVFLLVVVSALLPPSSTFLYSSAMLSMSSASFFFYFQTCLDED